MSAKALNIQLFLRGIDADDPEYSLEGFRRTGRQKGLTEKQYYLSIAKELIGMGEWFSSFIGGRNNKYNKTIQE